MLVHFELLVIATMIAMCQAFWWSSYPQTNSDENDSQMVRPIPFGYFRSYAYQPMMPNQYQSYFPNYYNPYMTFPQLLTQIPSRISQIIGKTRETIDEAKEKEFKSTTSRTTSTTTPTGPSPNEPAAISTTPPTSTSSVSQTIQIPTEHSAPKANAEPQQRMDQKYSDSFERMRSWTLRHNDIRAEQQPALDESQLDNAEAKPKIQFVPCMCPISVGVPIPISQAADQFSDNKIRRFEDLGEANVEDYTETHL